MYSFKFYNRVVGKLMILVLWDILIINERLLDNRYCSVFCCVYGYYEDKVRWYWRDWFVVDNILRWYGIFIVEFYIVF